VKRNAKIFFISVRDIKFDYAGNEISNTDKNSIIIEGCDIQYKNDNSYRVLGS